MGTKFTPVFFEVLGILGWLFTARAELIPSWVAWACVILTSAHLLYNLGKSWKDARFDRRPDPRRLPVLRSLFPVIFHFPQHLGLIGAKGEPSFVSAVQGSLQNNTNGPMHVETMRIVSGRTGEASSALVSKHGVLRNGASGEVILPGQVLHFYMPVNDGPVGSAEGRPDETSFMKDWGDFTFELVASGREYRKTFSSTANQRAFRSFEKVVENASRT